MTFGDALDLMRRYTNCPNCGSDKIGGGSGTLEVDTAAGHFKRTCKCGWYVEVTEGKKNGN